MSTLPNQLKELIAEAPINIDGDVQTQIAKHVVDNGVLWENLHVSDQYHIDNYIRQHGWVNVIKTHYPFWQERFPELDQEESTTLVDIGHVNDFQKIESTPERKRLAEVLDAKLQENLFETYLILSRIVDEKLYQELNFESAKDYFEAKKIQPRQAYRFAAIGRVIKELPNGVTSMSHLVDIGPTRLYELSINASDQVEELARKGVINIGDEELTAEQLQNTTIKDLKRKLREAEKKAEQTELLETRERANQLEIKALQKEKEELEAFKLKHASRAENIDLIERDLEDMPDILAQWAKKASDVAAALQAPDSPESLIGLWVERVQAAEMWIDRIRQNHPHLFL